MRVIARTPQRVEKRLRGGRLLVTSTWQEANEVRRETYLVDALGNALVRSRDGASGADLSRFRPQSVHRVGPRSTRSQRLRLADGW
jgi:hypothetical protein